jgi:hypothetical protein
MAGLHDALGGHAEVLAACLGAAAIDTGLLGGERLVDRPTVRANALRAPTEGFEIFAGCFDALEMGSVELRVFCGGFGCGHGINPVLMFKT